MGSSTSLGIGVSAEVTYHPGSVVSGTVYLNAQSDVNASYLQIALSGEEHTTVKYKQTTGSGKNRKTKTKYVRASHTFFCLRWNLAEFVRGTCPAGQWEYPFTLSFPPVWLPSSCSAFNNGSHCQIVYVLEARLHKPGWFTWDTLARKPIQFMAWTPPAKPIRPVLVHDDAHVRLCCCINRGSMSLGAAVDKDAFKAGQDLQVLYEATNASTVDVTGILVSLDELVSWSAGSHRQSMVVNQLHGISPTKLNAGSKYIALEEDPFHFVVNANFRQSFTGNLISVSHCLSVTLQTACCVTNPRVEIPVQIYSDYVSAEKIVETNEDGVDSDDDGVANTLLEVGATQLPPAWNARVAASLNLDAVAVVDRINPNLPTAVAVPVYPVEAGPAAAGNPETIEMAPLAYEVV